MTKRNDRLGARWWEYLWYMVVLLFFILIGALIALWSLVSGRAGHLGRIAGLGILSTALLMLFVVWGGWHYIETNDLGNRRVELIVKPGDTYYGVADRLIDRGIIDSRRWLVWPARLFGLDRSLIPGKYVFTGRNSCRTVLDRLARGDILRVRVTVPEGATIWQVASLLHRHIEIDSAAFVALNHDSELLRQLELPCLEGYLFPETYYLPWGCPLRLAVREMTTMFRAQTRGFWPDPCPCGLDREGLVIMASIVEAETGLGSERSLVASVYCNRLKDRMRLEADPTVIYGMGGLDRPLMLTDLEIDNPFNTYRRRGLPPTPICSPGLAALRAAAAPAESEFYFFVADNTGGHRFSRTFEEHERAIAELRGR